MSALAAFGTGIASARAAVPVELDRDSARARARRELARPEYQADAPSLFERVVTRVLEFLGGLLDGAAGVSPGGYAGLVVIIALLAVAIVAVRRKVGPLGRSGATEESLFLGSPRTASEHRRAAEEHAAAGRWDEALRERLRTVIRDLEERGLLDARPGRTAGEAARDGGAALPSCADGLRAAARAFDDVWYGGRVATRVTYEAVVALDELVRRTRPPVPVQVAVAGSAAGEAPR